MADSPSMQTLASYVESHGPLPVRDAMGWVLRAAQTLWVFHAEAQPHGRLHAGTILIEDADCHADGLLLRPSEAEDDPLYHSIARVDGMGPTLRDDVWALAVTLYYALTGRLPFPKGIAAALEGGRFRAPPPLAVSRSELDVMQPIVDRFLRLDDPDIATTVEQLIFAVQEFSPTIADLPVLPSSASEEEADASVPRDDGGRSPERSDSPARALSPRRRVERRRQLALGLVVAGAVFLGLSLLASQRNEPSQDGRAVASPPGPIRPPSSLPSPQPPLPKAANEPARPSPSVRPVDSAPSGEATSEPVEPAPAALESAEDMVACLSTLFPADAFSSHKPVAEFPCRERDGSELREVVTATLAQGGGGKATEAAREWSHLGWYQLAAITVARAHCCGSKAIIEMSPLLEVCDITGALDGLGQAVTRGNDQRVAEALQAYGRAAQCAFTAGGARFFGQQQPPTSHEAAVFLRIATRLRARRAKE